MLKIVEKSSKYWFYNNFAENNVFSCYSRNFQFGPTVPPGPLECHVLFEWPLMPRIQTFVFSTNVPVGIIYYMSKNVSAKCGYLGVPAATDKASEEILLGTTALK